MTSAGVLRIPWVILKGPVAKSSWLATMQVLTGSVLAVISFVVMLFLALIGLAVLPTVVLVAVPFVALLACSDVLTAWQRSRIEAFSGVRIPASAGLMPRGGGSLLTDLLVCARRLRTWRQIGYHLLAGPAIALAGGITVAVAWGAGLMFATLPLQYVLSTPGRGNLDKDMAASVAGWLVLFAAPQIARAAAWLEVATARLMLGPGQRERLAQLEESRAGAISAADTERRRIERDLHDGAQQRLVSMAMRLGLALATLDDLPDDARQVLERVHEDAKAAVRDLRDLVQGLHPAILNDRGLDAALSGIAARAPFPVTVDVRLGTTRLPSATEAVAFFIVSEGLTNAAKHGGASRGAVTVRRDGRVLRVLIRDDGKGGARIGAAGGLHGLAQRAASVDGVLRVDSPSGGPTVLTAELPC